MTEFDKTIDTEALLKAINTPFKEDKDIAQIILKYNLKAEKYFLETQNMFSSSPEQLKKFFTI